jgi:hypothetical protein
LGLKPTVETRIESRTFNAVLESDLKTRLMHRMMSAFMFMAPKGTLRQNIPELQE